MVEPKDVIVTGASGFLGRHVALDWARAGHRVIGIGRAPWEEAEWRCWGLTRWVQGDVTRENLARLDMQPAVVVHCAGSGSVAFSYQDPYNDFQATVGSLLPTLEFMRTRAPQAVLVYPSSAAVYGELETLPVREDAPLRPVSPYGCHKLMAEDLCRSHANHFGMRATIVRLFSLYGPQLRKQLLWDACWKFTRGDATFRGTGDELRDWVHVSDAAALLRIAADHPLPWDGTVNGASGVGTSVREILEILRAAFPNAPPLGFTTQAKTGDPSAYVGSTERARNWGWSPKSMLEAGILSYAEWFLRDRQ
jgi:UDP-glucose 4-epimerase